MKDKIRKILIAIIPLFAILILNYYLGTYAEFGKGNIKIKSILIIIAYAIVYFVVNTKNKYLNLNNLHKKRYYIIIILFVVLVGLKFHGSSISTWDNYYRDYGSHQTKTIYAGMPRAVRSDEWLVQTPLYLSQVTGEGTLSRVNSNIRSDGQDVVVSAYSPALDITNIGKPFNWGFLFLDKERGFSWYWNFKALGLFILSYEMAYILSRRNKKVGIIGAALMTFAPASQWWFSSIVDLIIFSQALVVSVYYYLKSSSIKIKAVNVVTFVVAGIGFVISLYPPIQVSLGYLTLIFLVYIVLKNRDKIKIKDIIVFILSVISILAVVAYFIVTAKDALSVLMGTVYPGARVELGGTRTFNDLSTYVFGWLLPYKNVIYSNTSELSGYVNLIPLIIILFFFRNRSEEDNKLKIVVFSYLLIMCSFVLIEYPVFLAKITLFSYIPPIRMIVTIGITATYFLCMLLPNLLENKNKAAMACITTIASIAIIFIPLFKTAAYEYLGQFGFIVAIILFTVLIYYIARGYITEIIPYVVIFMLITGFFVNPIARGLGPIYEKEISKAITRIDKESPGKWAALDSLVGGEFLNANGVKVFNSSHHYPDLKMWEMLDKNDQYENVYNRFAHIIVKITKDENSFELVQDDVFTVNINMSDFEKTGIKYVLSGAKLDEFNNNKEVFKELYYNDIDKLYIYEYLG